MEPRKNLLRRIVAATAVCAAVLVAAAVPANAAFVPPYVPTFPDVPTTHPFYLEVEWLVAEGITTGYEDGLFKPAASVSRQAIAAFIYRYKEGSGPATLCSNPPFTDVPISHPFCGEIAWAKANGIVKGYPDGSFHPVDAVQRQALAAFMYRLAGEPNGTHPTCTTMPFSDIPTTHAFCGEISWAKTNGIVMGYSDGTYKPTNPVTRQAFASILYHYDDTYGTSSVSAMGAAAAPGASGTDGTGGTTDPGPAGTGATENASGAQTGVITGGSNGATLPITGGNVGSVAVLGILLAGGGVLLVVGTRRRRGNLTTS